MSQTKFSKTLPINLESLQRVPNDKPGLYRIINKKKQIILFGMVKGGQIHEEILNHRGSNNEGIFFQYKIASSNKEAEKMQEKELEKWRPVFN